MVIPCVVWFQTKWIRLRQTQSLCFQYGCVFVFYALISSSTNIESRAEKGLRCIPNQRSLQLLRASENVKFHVLVQNMQTDILRPLNRELLAYSKANLDTVFLNNSSSKSWAFQVLEDLHSAETAKPLFEHHTQSNIINVVKEQKKSKSEASQEVQRFSKWDDRDECLLKETVALKDKIGQQAIGTTGKIYICTHALGGKETFIICAP